MMRYIIQYSIKDIQAFSWDIETFSVLQVQNLTSQENEDDSKHIFDIHQ